MKRGLTILILLIFALSFPALAQEKHDNSGIDMMLIKGDFKGAIDTCRQILASDSLNPDVYYKLGLAYQNVLSDDKSFDCFLKAATLAPGNNNYNFTLAKSYFNKGKTEQAKLLLQNLVASDSMYWPYSSYLTNIYMQEGKYDESIKLYYRFYRKDYFNYVFADKIGFAYLQKDDPDKAMDMFKRSLELNPKNLNAIKNLAYLIAGNVSADSAIKLLTKGIKIDSTDLDLYVRRAAINFTIFNYTVAMKDYLKLVSSGDSSVLNLKRAGIGLAISHHPEEAVVYLLKAYNKDTADYEIMSGLAQNYAVLKDLKHSAYFYRSLIKVLNPVEVQLGLNYLLLAEVLKSDNKYSEAISAYIKSQEFRTDISVNMIIANLYDEKLNDASRAIRYYELYLNKMKNSSDKYDADYTEKVTKRIEALKKIKQQGKQTK